MASESDWMRAIEQTFVVRSPKQHLATFGITNISYYVVTEPIFTAFDSEKANLEGVVRKGRVIAQRPSLITPTYAMNLKGFSSEAYEYLGRMSARYGPNSPGILYQYRNEAENLDIVSGVPSEIAHRISDDLEEKKENMSVVMVGIDEFWDVALLKFIYEFTSLSASQNIGEFRARGLLEPQGNIGGVPRAAVDRVEKLFRGAEDGGDRDELKRELDRWGIFEYYEARFLNLFRKR